MACVLETVSVFASKYILYRIDNAMLIDANLCDTLMLSVYLTYHGTMLCLIMAYPVVLPQ